MFGTGSTKPCSLGFRHQHEALPSWMEIVKRLRQLSVTGVDSRGLRRTGGDSIFGVNNRSENP